MNKYKIVLTGGPRGGKTTIINLLKERFEKENVNLYVVPETATELATNLVKPQDVPTIKFQDSVFKRQIFKEREVYDVINYTSNNNLDNIILLDRGVFDNKAYLNNNELFNSLLDKYNENEIELLDDYDLVIYLESSSKNNNLDYELKTNKARYEDREEAKIIDQRTAASWLGHDNFHIIKSTDKFEDKEKKVIDIIKNKGLKKHITNINDYNYDYYLDCGKKIYKEEVIINNNTKIIKRKSDSYSCYYLVKNNNKKVITKNEYYRIFYKYSDNSIINNYLELYFIEDDNVYKIVSSDKSYLISDTTKLPKELKLKNSLKRYRKVVL